MIWAEERAEKEEKFYQHKKNMNKFLFLQFFSVFEKNIKNKFIFLVNGKKKTISHLLKEGSTSARKKEDNPWRWRFWPSEKKRNIKERSREYSAATMMKRRKGNREREG